LRWGALLKRVKLFMLLFEFHDHDYVSPIHLRNSTYHTPRRDV